MSTKIWGIMFLISFVTCNPIRPGRYAVADENSELNDLTPPLDPAINNFPKAPLIPLMPMCEHAGYFRDPFNCGKFYRCNHSRAIPMTFHCLHGFIFNEQTETCDEPYLVDC